MTIIKQRRGCEYGPPFVLLIFILTRIIPAVAEEIVGNHVNHLEMAKKSQAQIRRMLKRAEDRGENYQPPFVEEQEKSKDEGHNQPATDETDKADAKKAAIAKKLTEELAHIQSDQEIKAKDRRSAKRKAEALAAEAAGCPVSDLLEWYEEYVKATPELVTKGDKKKKPNKNPYIVFIGQLSYETTKEGLFTHIKKELEKEYKVTKESLDIRMLNDPKSNRSKGMAFVEVLDPELMYACLKLHHTVLDGRRINVERSAGGRKNSETRKAKIKLYREEQEQYMGEIVDNIFSQFRKSGDIREDEFDDAAVTLCKQHSARIVKTAIERYVESNGRDMDNPSAYLTFLVTKFAKEGIIESEKGQNGMSNDRPRKRLRTENSSNGKALKKHSEFAKEGIDMSRSERKGSNLARLFPSFTRGRGRGRSL